MFANKLRIKRSINTCQMLGRLIYTCMGRMGASAALLLRIDSLDWFIELHSTSCLGMSRFTAPTKYFLCSRIGKLDTLCISLI